MNGFRFVLIGVDDVVSIAFGVVDRVIRVPFEQHVEHRHLIRPGCSTDKFEVIVHHDHVEENAGDIAFDRVTRFIGRPTHEVVEILVSTTAVLTRIGGLQIVQIGTFVTTAVAGTDAE